MKLNWNSLLIFGASIVLIVGWTSELGYHFDPRMAAPMCVLIFCLFNAILAKREDRRPRFAWAKRRS